MPYHNLSNPTVKMNEMEQMIYEVESLRVRVSGSTEFTKSQINRMNDLLAIVHRDLIRWNADVQQSTNVSSVDTIESGDTVESEDTLRHSDAYYDYFRNR